MSNPFAAPPKESADLIPPNRAPKPNAKRTIVTWLLLIVVFVAIYQVFATSPQPRAPEPDTSAIDARPSRPLGWLVPLLAYGGMVVGLVVVRRRLPAKYRTGELREIAAKRETPVPDPSPAPIALALDGTDGSRPVRLHIDDRGLYWYADERVLQTARELRVAWSELEAISTSRVRSGLVVWGVVVAGFALGMVRTQTAPGLAAIAIGLALAVVGWRSTRGMLTFVTPTHALSFQSKALDTAAQDAIMAAARARCPKAVAPPAKGGAWKALFGEPFLHLVLAFQSDASLRTRLLREGSNPPDEETAMVGAIQWRLFALWNGVLRAGGPVSVAIGAVLALGDPALTIPLAFVAWIFGFIVVLRTMTAFARFAGMSIVR